MTNNDVRPYENEGNTNGTADPATGQDSDDSPTSATSRTEIGSEGSTHTEGGQPIEGSDLDPDQTVWMPPGRHTNQRTRLHLTADCRGLGEQTRSLRAAGMPDRLVCQYCDPNADPRQDFDEVFVCPACGEEYRTEGDLFRHEVLTHRGNDADDEPEVRADGGTIQTADHDPTSPEHRLQAVDKQLRLAADAIDNEYDAEAIEEARDCIRAVYRARTESDGVGGGTDAQGGHPAGGDRA